MAKNKRKILIATSLLAPPDYSGMGKRIINYLEIFSKNHNVDCVLATSSNFKSKNIETYKYPVWPKYVFIKIPFLYKILKLPILFIELFVWFPISFLKSTFLVFKYPNASFLISSARDPISISLLFVCTLFGKAFILGTSLSSYDDEKTLLQSNLSFLFSFFIKKAKYFILISPALDAGKKSIAKSLITIPNGINIDIQQQNKINKDKKYFRSKLSIPNRITLITVGRISKRKKSLEIFMLIKRLIDCQIEVNLITLGPFDFKKDRYSSVCKKYIEENLLENYIFNFGYVLETDLFYRASDISISLSTAEGFPNSLVEAMSYSIPPVHSLLEKTSRYILGDSLLNELTFQNKNEMYELIKTLVLNKEKRKILGKGSKKRAKLFDIKNIVSQYNCLLFN